jgi:hypothetical protein
MEIWKDIEGYEGLYQVSNLGRIKSLERKVKNQFNEYIIKEKIKKLSDNGHGYLHLTLYKNGKFKQFYIHRIVAEAFLSNSKNYLEINHKDGNKQNNCIDNLEWCTSSQNKKHAFKIGLKISKKGRDNDKSIKIKQMDKNNKLINIFYGIREAERKTNINHTSIILCCKGKRKTAGGYKWKYLVE